MWPTIRTERSLADERAFLGSNLPEPDFGGLISARHGWMLVITSRRSDRAALYEWRVAHRSGAVRSPRLTADIA